MDEVGLRTGDRAGYAATMSRLAAAQKASRGAGIYSRFVNRPLGRRLACVAYLMGLTPNKVTCLSAIFTFAGIALIATAPPTWIGAVAACLVLVVGYALDSADGQLARLRGGGSISGEWLDHMVDCVKLSTFHLAVLLSVFRFFDVDQRWALVPIGFAVVANAKFFGKILNDQLRRLAARGGERASLGDLGVAKTLLAAPTDYGFLILAVLLWPTPSAFLGVYTLMFVANLGFLLSGLVRWYAEMSRLQ